MHTSIRKWIQLIEDHHAHCSISLIESVIQIDGQNGTLIVLRNPVRTQFWNLMSKSSEHELKALLCDNDLYVWDAFEDHHESVSDELGVDVGLCLRLICNPDAIGIGLQPRSTREAIEAEINDLKTTPILQRLYAGRSVELYPYDPYDPNLQDQRFPHSF